MTEVKYNLLTESLITVEDEAGSSEQMTLPGVLARLSRQESSEFPGLQAHQFHAWHAFLVQLGAIAMDRHASTSFPGAEETWSGWLRDLTSGRDEPWCLVVNDLSQPAFMQPPVPEATVKEWDGPITEPDHPDLDLLVTAKSHDVKSGRILNARPEHWVFGLVALQTMQGYSGKANYGIARMNGGYGSRPSLGAARSDRLADRFCREVRIWIAQRGPLLSEHQFSESGLSLVWVEPWDGKGSLSLSELDPFFIEISRRVRLGGVDSRIAASRTTTAAPRISAKELKGDTGDIWTPVQPSNEGTKAFSSGEGGFSYKVLQALLFGADWKKPAALSIASEDGPRLFFSGRALARGQGVTQGFHERVLPIPPRVARLLGSKAAREGLGVLSRERVAYVDELRLKVLRPALLQLIQGGPEKLKLDDKRIDACSSRLDAAIDSLFFPRLFEAVEDPTGMRLAWQRELLEIATGILQEAINALPIPTARRYRAIAAAEAVFRAKARKWAPDLFQQGEVNGNTVQLPAAS